MLIFTLNLKNAKTFNPKEHFMCFFMSISLYFVSFKIEDNSSTHDDISIPHDVKKMNFQKYLV